MFRDGSPRTIKRLLCPPTGYYAEEVMKALLSRVKTLFFLAIWSGNLSPFSYALKENCKRSGGVNLHTITAESSTVRNKQDELTCSRNFSDVLLFRSKIRAELKEGKYTSCGNLRLW